MLTLSPYHEELALITEVNRKTYLDHLEYLNVSFYIPTSVPSRPLPFPHPRISLSRTLLSFSDSPSFSLSILLLPSFATLKRSSNSSNTCGASEERSAVHATLGFLPVYIITGYHAASALTFGPHSGAASRPTPAGKCTSRNTVACGTDGAQSSFT